MTATWRNEAKVLASHRHFKPLAAALARFRDLADFPNVGLLTAAAADLNLRNHQGQALRFVAAKPKPRGPARRRRKAESDYELRIFECGEVSTRVSNWHDFFNAIVWMTFPLSKAACNARQVEGRVPGVVRTREQDRLTIFDEGGVIEVRHAATHRCEHIVFGHAIYESLIYQRLPVRGLKLVVEVGDRNVLADAASMITFADQTVAQMIHAQELANGNRESFMIEA